MKKFLIFFLIIALLTPAPVIFAAGKKVTRDSTSIREAKTAESGEEEQATDASENFSEDEDSNFQEKDEENKETREEQENEEKDPDEKKAIAVAEEEPVEIPEPQVDPWKNLTGFKELFNTDLFTGAASFQVPFLSPAPPTKNALIPQLSLQYNSYSRDRLSPYGYGWNLSTNSIFRQTRFGINKIYDRDEYAFQLQGQSSELSLVESNLYMAELGNDLSKYYKEGNGWRVIDTQGNIYYFGQNSTSRQTHPDDSNKIFQWMLDKVVDIHGNKIEYSYFQDKNQIYPQSINYSFASDTQNLYRMYFNYASKTTSSLSYQTQFKIETYYLLSKIDIQHYTNSWNTIKSYELAYDSYENTIPRLVSVTEKAGSAMLPPLTFTYYDSETAIHLLKTADNNRGAKMMFEYLPSTAYKVGDDLANKLPFIVQTLRKVTYEDSVTGISFEESFEYAGSHFFIDYNDVFGREYAGFRTVKQTQKNRISKTYFHQSQFSENASDMGEYDDHISKKGRAYRSEIYDLNGNLYQTSITKWIHQDLGNNRYYVLPERTTMIRHDGTSTHTDTAMTYSYDSFANMLEEKNYGFVTANTDTGDFTDITGDTYRMVYTYALNKSANFVSHPSTKTLYDNSNALAAKEEYYYDGSATLGSISRGDMTRHRMYNDQTGSYISRDFTYTSRGNIETVSDFEGNMTTYGYDSTYYDYPIEITIEGNTFDRDLRTTYAYDFSRGLLENQIAPNGAQSQYDYDDFGRLSEVYISENYDTAQLILIESYDYNDTASPTYVEKEIWPYAGDPIVSRTYFDGFGRTIQTRSEHEESNYVALDQKYDSDGNILYASYPYFDSGLSYDASDWAQTKAGTQTSYDALARPDTITTQTGPISYTYDGIKTTITDQEGNVKDLYTDAYENLTQVTEYNEGASYHTYYEYNALNLLTDITDSQGNIREFTYNSLGHRLTLTDVYKAGNPLHAWIFTYDDNGNLLSQADPEENFIEYEYDEFNRVEKEKLDGMEQFSYTYSVSGFSKGMLVEATGANVSSIYDYDSHGNVASETRNIHGKQYVSGFETDILDRPRTINYPDDTRATYGYNTAGLLETISYSGTVGNLSIISDIDYSPLGQIATMTFGNGTTTTNTYDLEEMYRLRSKVTNKGSTKYQSIAYYYDVVGNITDLIDNSNTLSAKTVSYGYDDLYRLLSASASYGDASYNYARSYTYDSIGNMTYRSDVGTYSYSGAGNANPHAATTIGGTALTYDRNGNMITDGQRSLTYNYRNLISSAIYNGVTSAFVYDHAGNRVYKEGGDSNVWYANQLYEIRSTGSVDKEYVYIFAGNMRVASVEMVTDYDEDGDGWTEAEGDCDDSSGSVYPGAAETCGDGVDQDCSGADLSCEDVDNDGDGWTENTGDCDDFASSVYPGAAETCGDGIDQDCSGYDLSCADVDNDGDGWTENTGDCDDENAVVYPGALEVCGNSIDEDCSGTDLSCEDVDNDGDGVTENEGDCDDTSSSVYPGAAEICDNSIDEDCSGADLNCDDVDNDGDGWTENTGDCDDSSSSVYPGAAEICGDGVDQDCSGADLSCDDVDNDGDSWTENTGDCDDSSSSVYPGAPETCGDGVDQDCSGADLNCDDVDNDGDGWTENTGDCDDTSGSVYPGAAEICDDGIDQDCSGADLNCDDVDDDGDGWTENTGDCDDSSGSVYPGATEICGDGIDQNCDSYDKTCIVPAPIPWDVEKVLPEMEKPDIDWPSLRELFSSVWSFVTPDGKAAPTNAPTSVIPDGKRSAPDQESISGKKATKARTTTTLYLHFTDHLGSSSVTTDWDGNLVEVTDYFPYGGINVEQKFASYESDYTYNNKERDSELDLYYYGARYYNDTTGRFTSIDPALFDIQYLLKVLADPQRLNLYAYARNNPINFVDQNGQFACGGLCILGIIAGIAAYLVSEDVDVAQAPSFEMDTSQTPSTDVSITEQYAKDAQTYLDEKGLGIAASAVMLGVEINELRNIKKQGKDFFKNLKNFNIRKGRKNGINVYKNDSTKEKWFGHPSTDREGKKIEEIYDSAGNFQATRREAEFLPSLGRTEETYRNAQGELLYSTTETPLFGETKEYLRDSVGKVTEKTRDKFGEIFKSLK